MIAIATRTDRTPLAYCQSIRLTNNGNEILVLACPSNVTCHHRDIQYPPFTGHLGVHSPYIGLRRAIDISRARTTHLHPITKAKLTKRYDFGDKGREYLERLTSAGVHPLDTISFPQLHSSAATKLVALKEQWRVCRQRRSVQKDTDYADTSHE